MKSASPRIAISVVLSGLLPLAVGLAGLRYLPSWAGEWSWHAEALHSTMESVGGVSALTLGMLLILVAKQNKAIHPHVWLATALVAKGILDLFHAGLGPTLPFVWLRCLSTLIGGTLFAASWLPETCINPRRLYTVPAVAAGGAVVLALAALFFPGLPSTAIQGQAFSPLTRIVNTSGGLLYLVAAVYFLTQYRRSRRTDDLLWLNVSLLFGVSGLMFDPSLHWNYAWWFWHVMRLLAWFLCLGYFFAKYAQAERAVRQAHDELAEEVLQRQLAEERINIQNQFLKTIIESLAYPFYVMDVSDYKLRIANSAATLGDHADGTTCYSLAHNREKPCAGMYRPCPLQEVRETGKPTIVEHVLSDKSGNVRNMEIHAYPIADDTGRVIQLIEYCLDITERKIHEQEREQLITELASKNAELERFTYTVSHDLKSPLITIKGFLGYLAKDLAAGDMERLRSDTARINVAVEKMSQLLDDLLELSRVGRIVNPPTDVPMTPIVKTALDMLAGRIAEQRVTVDVPDDLPVLYGDAARLREVVENLLDNAIKFAGNRPCPRVEIQIRPDNNRHIICVKDNGIGIEGQYHEKIFQLFERLEHAVEGTGIGLTIVKRIVEIHGGQIWVESDGVGQGSAFCFALPKRKESFPDAESTV